jgi:ferredoxin-NADP reductase
VGDEVEVKGPFPKLAYTPNMKRAIGMVAGGTGITPMLQVAEEILSNPADKTEVSLIFASECFIMLCIREDEGKKKMKERERRRKRVHLVFVPLFHSCERTKPSLTDVTGVTS